MLHDDLVRALAQHLRSTADRMVWEDMQLGPSGSPRPDVYAIPKSYARFSPLAYEVKVSRADFHRDVSAGKWQQYLEFACAVVFAVPAGLVSRQEIPKGCGLMSCKDGAWSTLKAPTLGRIKTLPHEAWMKLLIDGVGRAHRERNTKLVTAHSIESSLRKRYGDVIAKAFRAADGAEQSFLAVAQHYETELEKLRENHEALRARWKKDLADDCAKLAEALGLEPGAQPHQVSHRLRELNASSSKNQFRRLNRELKRARSIIDGAIAETETEALTAPESPDWRTILQTL